MGRASFKTPTRERNTRTIVEPHHFDYGPNSLQTLGRGSRHHELGFATAGTVKEFSLDVVNDQTLFPTNVVYTTHD